MWQGQALNPHLSDFRAHEYKHYSILLPLQQCQLSSGAAKCATVAGIVRSFVSSIIYSEGLGRKHSSWDRNNGGCYSDGMIKVWVSTPIFLYGLLILNSIYFAMEKQLWILFQSKCHLLKDIWLLHQYPGLGPLPSEPAHLVGLLVPTSVFPRTTFCGQDSFHQTVPRAWLAAQFQVPSSPAHRHWELSAPGCPLQSHPITHAKGSFFPSVHWHGIQEEENCSEKKNKDFKNLY